MCLELNVYRLISSIQHVQFTSLRLERRISIYWVWADVDNEVDWKW